MRWTFFFLVHRQSLHDVGFNKDKNSDPYVWFPSVQKFPFVFLHKRPRIALAESATIFHCCYI